MPKSKFILFQNGYLVVHKGDGHKAHLCVPKKDETLCGRKLVGMDNTIRDANCVTCIRVENRRHWEG